MKKVIVDIGSDGVRVFQAIEDKRILEFEKKIDFAENYHPDRGLNFNDEEALIRIIERVSANYFNYKIEAVASGIFAQMPLRLFAEINNESIRRSRIPITIAP